MKITIPLVPNVFAYPMGGTLVGFEYANRLAARGHDVVLAYVRPTPDVLRALGLDRIYLDLPGPDEAPRVTWFSVDGRVSSVWFDLSDVSTLPDADILLNGPASCDRKKGLGVALIQGFGILPREAEDAVYLAPGRKVCVSRWVRDELRARGAAEEDLAHVPNGVDTEVFRIQQPIETRPPRVAMLHHYLPVKGTDVGLEALEMVRKKLPETEAVLFGTQPRPDNLPSWIAYRRLPSRSELSELYNSSAVLICPSRGDGFYLCGLEAMACGCALASTDIGGVRDYADHDVTALLSAQEDPVALAKSVSTLLSDASHRTRIAKAAAKRALEFSWERATDSLVAHIESWLAQRA